MYLLIWRMKEDQGERYVGAGGERTKYLLVPNT